MHPQRPPLLSNQLSPHPRPPNSPGPQSETQTGDTRSNVIHPPGPIRQDDPVTLLLPTLDAFAGAGGLSLGLQAVGLPVTVAADSSTDALQTYQRHHRATEILEGDIASHTFRRYKGSIAIVAGGPPCQPWSSGDSVTSLPSTVKDKQL